MFYEDNLGGRPGSPLSIPPLFVGPGLPQR